MARKDWTWLHHILKPASTEICVGCHKILCILLHGVICIFSYPTYYYGITSTIDVHWERCSLHACEWVTWMSQWVIHICDMTHSYVWHECAWVNVSFTCVTRLIQTCDMPHSYVRRICNLNHSNVWHASFKYAPSFTHMCIMPYSNMQHASFTYATCLTHMCVMPHTITCPTHMCVMSHTITCLTHMCVIPHAYVYLSLFCTPSRVHVRFLPQTCRMHEYSDTLHTFFDTYDTMQ